MGQTAGQIESYIESKRVDLGENLRELETRVRSATDWRYQFESRPMWFLGAAVGGGMLLGWLTRSSSPTPREPVIRAESSFAPRREWKRTPSPAMDNAMRAWENIKGALIGIAAQRAKEYAEGIIPGFARQYDRTDSEHRI